MSALVHNLVLFVDLLRSLGIGAGTARVVDLVTALESIDLGRRSDVRDALRCLLVIRKEDLALFDEAFEIFWRKPREGETALDLRAMGERRRFRKPKMESRPPEEGADDSGEGREAVREGQPVLHPFFTYSAREVLRHKDFERMSGEELDAIRAWVPDIVLRLRERRTRRRRPGPRGQHDLRRSLRHSLRTEGEILRWMRLERRQEPRGVVILADVSGSMERYTRVLLLFAYAMAQRAPRRIEAFVFGTRLTRITRHLRGRDPERAMLETARSVQDWSGGTRIGEALRSFNVNWARRVRATGSTIIVISDGWDRGDLELLRKEMARLQRSCRRLIWLNPLLGREGFEPLTGGMRSALPFVDDLLPAHNLASLEDLARRLATLRPGD